MKVLIVCSGNAEATSLEIHHPFIYDQVNALKKKYPEIILEYFFIRGKGILGYLSNLRAFNQFLAENSFDLIHAHYGLSGLLANLQFRVPVVTTFHGSDVNFWYLNILSSITNLLTDEAIFVSNKLIKRIIYKKRKQKMHLIPCGIDLSVFYPLNRDSARNYFNFHPDKKYILFSSSFSKKVKNYTLAEKAINLLNDDSINVVELKNFSRSEVNLLLNASDVALMTSFTEGSPQFIKEAMAVNCPIVSTDVGDVRDLMQDTEGSFTSTYSPSDVADKLEKALRLNRTNGRKKIEHLDNEFIAGEIYDIYQSLSEAKNGKKL